MGTATVTATATDVARENNPNAVRALTRRQIVIAIRNRSQKSRASKTTIYRFRVPHAGRVRLLRLSVVGRLPNACPEFFQPFGPVLSMNDAAEEPERFGNVVAVEPDVLPGRLGILPHPLLDIVWLCEDVGRMTGLRHLDDYRFLEIENVFVTEHVHRSRALG